LSSTALVPRRSVQPRSHRPIQARLVALQAGTGERVDRWRRKPRGPRIQPRRRILFDSGEVSCSAPRSSVRVSYRPEDSLFAVARSNGAVDGSIPEVSGHHVLASCEPRSGGPFISRVPRALLSRRCDVVMPNSLDPGSSPDAWPPLHEANHAGAFGHWHGASAMPWCLSAVEPGDRPRGSSIALVTRRSVQPRSH
jgi:hypothetical protein